MDRIRKALDLARQERDAGGEAVTVRPAPAAPLRAVPSLPKSIVYTQTKVFTPSERLLESNRIVDPSSVTAPAAAFRMLRTQVLHRLEENAWRSLAILSPNADDGKTTTAINLAISLANEQRHTVLLVECDLKHPSMAERLGLSVEAGLNDV